MGGGIISPLLYSFDLIKINTLILFYVWLKICHYRIVTNDWSTRSLQQNPALLISKKDTYAYVFFEVVVRMHKLFFSQWIKTCWFQQQQDWDWVNQSKRQQNYIQLCICMVYLLQLSCKDVPVSNWPRLSIESQKETETDGKWPTTNRRTGAQSWRGIRPMRKPLCVICIATRSTSKCVIRIFIIAMTGCITPSNYSIGSYIRRLRNKTSLSRYSGPSK